jgi:hypothetical protein
MIDVEERLRTAFSTEAEKVSTQRLRSLMSALRVDADPPKNMWTRYPPFEPGYTDDSLLLIAGEPSVDLRSTSPSRMISGREVFVWSSPPDFPAKVFQAQHKDSVCGTILVEIYNTERFDEVIPRVRCELVNNAPQARLDGRSFDDAQWTSVAFGVLSSVVVRYRLSPASGPRSYVTINLQRLIGPPPKLPGVATSTQTRRLIDGRSVVSRLDDVFPRRGSEKGRIAEVELSPTESAFLTMPPEATWDDVEKVVRALQPVEAKRGKRRLRRSASKSHNQDLCSPL